MTNYLAFGGVQQVSITIAAGATSGTATLPKTVGAGAFILFQGCNPSDTGTQLNDSLARVALTNTTTVTATRGATGVSKTVVVNAVVIDGDTTNLIKSVQSGTIVFGTGDSSQTATISAVTNANTAVAYLGESDSTSSTSLLANECILSLSGTTVTATKRGTGTADTVGYCVIEFQGTALNQAVQNVAYSATHNGSSDTVTITSVNRNNSFLVYSGSNANLTVNESQALQYGQLTAATTFTTTWNTSSNVARAYNCCVVEFVAGVLNSNVQRGTIAVSAQTSNTATITSVDTTAAFCNWLGNSSSATVLNPSVSRYNITQTNATTLTMTANTSATGTGSYEVVEFPAYVASGSVGTATGTATVSGAGGLYSGPVSFFNGADAFTVLTASNSPVIAQNFDMSSYPSGFTYTRADTVATYRDSAGKLQVAASNTPRIDYDINGVLLGLRVEGTSTNLCTNYNMIPTDGTNISVTGTVTLSQVTDATAIAAYKADAIVTSKVQSAAGGASGGTVVIAGATGATGTFSAQIVARVTAGSSASFGITPSPSAVTISGAAYALYFANGLTSTNAADTMVITIPAGVTVLFMLNQLEARSTCSSVIKIAGATAVRATEVNVDSSITSRSYYNSAQGSIIANVTFDDILTNGADNQILLCAGTGLTYAIGVSRLAGATRSKCFFRGYVNSVNQFTSESGVDVAAARYPVAVSWIDGVTFTAAGCADSYQTVTPSGAFVGIDRIYLGCRAFSEFMFGHITSLTFYTSYMSPAQLGQVMVNSGDKVVSTCGQSNMTDWFQAQSGANNSGQRQAVADLNTFLTSTRNFLVNGGTVGTSVIYYSGTSSATNWWLNTTTGARGAPFSRWIDMALGCNKGTYIALIDTSGESDAGAATQQQFVDAQIQKFNIMRSYIGAVPVFIIPIGRNTSALSGYQTIKQAQQQLASENPTWIYLCPERFDLALSDSIHLADGPTGTTPDADRTTRKILSTLGYSISGPVDGSTVATAARTGASIVVGLAHPAGITDFTPSSAIQGFRFFDVNGAEVSFTSQVRTDANTITLTLASNPAGSGGTLYYGYASLNEITDLTKLVHGNDANALPLRAVKAVLPYTG